MRLGQQKQDGDCDRNTECFYTWSVVAVSPVHTGHQGGPIRVPTHIPKASKLKRVKIRTSRAVLLP